MAETEAAPEAAPKDATEEVPVKEEITPEIQKKIVKQMEYYFGDYNLPRDRFMRQQAELDDGWLPMDLMLKFVRLKTLAKEADVIVEAMEKIGSELLELSEDKQKVRRSPSKPYAAFDEAMQQETMKRTVYCKGFPLDETLEPVLAFFSQYGKTDTVQMRSYREKNCLVLKFKGSVFAVFKTPELAEAFMKLESVKYKDVELIRKWQKDYNEEKKLERAEKFNKGKKKASPETKEEEEKEVKEEILLPTGCYLHIKGISGDVAREDLRTAVQSKCDTVVPFIEYNKGDGEAFVRLQGQDSATKAVELLGEGGQLEVCGAKVTVEAMSAEEEAPLREKAQQFLNNNRRGKKSGGGGGGGGGHFRRGGKRRGGFRGGHGNSRRDRGDRGDRGERAPKRAKTEGGD